MPDRGEWARRGAIALALVGALALLAALATPLLGLFVDPPEAGTSSATEVEVDPEGDAGHRP